MRPLFAMLLLLCTCACSGESTSPALGEYFERMNSEFEEMFANVHDAARKTLKMSESDYAEFRRKNEQEREESRQKHVNALVKNNPDLYRRISFQNISWMASMLFERNLEIRGDRVALLQPDGLVATLALSTGEPIEKRKKGRAWRSLDNSFTHGNRGKEGKKGARQLHDTLLERYGGDSTFPFPVPGAVVEFSNGGMAWISVRRNPGAEPTIRLLYRDDENHWEGSLGTVADEVVANEIGDHMFVFTMDANNEYIVYATSYGKLECLNRKDGSSRWIYVFPTVLLRDAYARFTTMESFLSFGPFYTDRLEVRKYEMAAVTVAPFHVDGVKPNPVPILRDPTPEGEDTITIMMILAWLAPLAGLTLLCWSVMVKKSNQVYPTFILLGIVLLLGIKASVGYSPATCIGWYAVTALAIVCCALNKRIRRRLHRVEEAPRNSRESGA